MRGYNYESADGNYNNGQDCNVKVEVSLFDYTFTEALKAANDWHNVSSLSHTKHEIMPSIGGLHLVKLKAEYHFNSTSEDDYEAAIDNLKSDLSKLDIYEPYIS